MSALVHRFVNGFIQGMFAGMAARGGVFGGFDGNIFPSFSFIHYRNYACSNGSLPQVSFGESLFKCSPPVYSAGNNCTINWQTSYNNNYSNNYKWNNWQSDYSSSKVYDSFVLSTITSGELETKNEVTHRVSGTKGAPYQPRISNSEYNQYNDLILKYAEMYDVDPNLVKAVIKRESVFDPNAGSGAGARGLMQLMPSTARQYKVTNVYDPEQNIRGGVQLLSYLLKRYNGDIKMVLAAYNWGLGNLDREGFENRPSETRTYVDLVSQYYEEYSKA